MNTERPQQIQRRLAELNGFLKGTKPDMSPPAQDERNALRCEWDRIGYQNHGEAIEAILTRHERERDRCAHCGHNGGYHGFVYNGGCFFPLPPDELCICSGYEYAGIAP